MRCCNFTAALCISAFLHRIDLGSMHARHAANSLVGMAKWLAWQNNTPGVSTWQCTLSQKRIMLSRMNSLFRWATGFIFLHNYLPVVRTAVRFAAIAPAGHHVSGLPYWREMMTTLFTSFFCFCSRDRSIGLTVSSTLLLHTTEKHAIIAFVSCVRVTCILLLLVCCCMVDGTR